MRVGQLSGDGKRSSREDLESQEGHLDLGKGPYGGDLKKGKVKKKKKKGWLESATRNAGRVCPKRGSRRGEGGPMGGA